jgi:hypothetical protein
MGVHIRVLVCDFLELFKLANSSLDEPGQLFQKSTIQAQKEVMSWEQRGNQHILSRKIGTEKHLL